MKIKPLLILLVSVSLACSSASRIFRSTPIAKNILTSTPSGWVDAPMLLVPAGEFSMDSGGRPDNGGPVHQVFLDDYYIDKYEVTNAYYEFCVEADVCYPPTSSSSYTRSSYYGNPEFDNYPVIYVNWNMAKTYCEWRGAQLPTEAQWEKAARGTDGRDYPWGEGFDCAKANSYISAESKNCVGDTTEVGSYASGASPYGALDMGGNVYEWVADWYEPSYTNAPYSNPTGPASGEFRVVRGGSWSMGDYYSSTWVRNWAVPGLRSTHDGFRCAGDATP